MFFLSCGEGEVAGGVGGSVLNPRKTPCRFGSGDMANRAGDKLKRET